MNFILRQWPGILWILFILVLTGVPGNYFPEVKSFWDWISPDKLVHLFMFGTLSILLLYANKTQYFEQKFRYAFWIIFTGVVLGALTEYLQSTLFVRRDGNWFDFIANILGTIFGVFVFILFYRKKSVK
jgi:VanZ family protein